LLIKRLLFKDHNDNDIQEIRARFFDPILMMEAELRKAKETGLLSDSIKEFFQSQFLTLHLQINGLSIFISQPTSVQQNIY
jgi:hypothetical protein